MHDDPRRVRGLRSRAFDGEGTPTAARAIDRRRRADHLAAGQPLGAAAWPAVHRPRRARHRRPAVAVAHQPVPRRGQLTPAELMADIKLGLYVTELIGMGVNGVTGDYSRGAAGFMIRDGALAEPVAEITIAGNLLEMFAHLTPGQRPAVPPRHRRADGARRRHDDGWRLTGARHHIAAHAHETAKHRMRRTSSLLAAVAALALALAPGLADARAGGGGSFGSRGSMTWSAPPSTSTAPYAAAPMQRSMTPNSPSPGYRVAAPGFGPASAPRSGFMSGLMGGLIGAGIGGLLFGHGFFGGGLGFGGFLGFLLQIFLIVLLVRFLIRLFRGPSPALRRRPGHLRPRRRTRPGPMGGGFGGPRRPAADPDRPAGLPGVRAAAAGHPGRLEPARPERAARDGDAGDAQLLRRAAWPSRPAAACATRSPTCACCKATWRRPGARAAANTPRWRCASR